jgi:hypothetical protein
MTGEWDKCLQEGNYQCLLWGRNVHEVEFYLFNESGKWIVAAKTWGMVTAWVNWMVAGSFNGYSMGELNGCR